MHIANDELTFRSARPEDCDAVRAFLERLSPDSRWLRYHAPAPLIRGWMVDAVVKADHEHREALIALMNDTIVGVAEWGRIDTDDPVADVGVVVDECCRRRGIARELLTRLAASGRAHGIETFEATVLSTNRPTIALTQSVAPLRTVTFDGPTIAVTIPLSAAS